MVEIEWSVVSGQATSAAVKDLSKRGLTSHPSATYLSSASSSGGWLASGQNVARLSARSGKECPIRHRQTYRGKTNVVEGDGGVGSEVSVDEGLQHVKGEAGEGGHARRLNGALGGELKCPDQWVFEVMGRGGWLVTMEQVVVESSDEEAGVANDRGFLAPVESPDRS